jgi:16S rRNA (cytosine967-C5)-methyltransferase
LISPARTIAFNVLLDTHRGGYASELLLARSAKLDSRDAGLAHELVFGCLRFQLQLDFLVQHYAGRPQRLDPEVRIALHLGLYQLRYLDRIPRHAAVMESVELAKRSRKPSVAGFVNAVLRKSGREPVRWPSPAIELSCPEWLLTKWVGAFGRDTAHGIARAALSPPETWIRLSDAGAPGAELEPADVPGGYRLLSGPLPPGARIQDIGSQSIVPWLDLKPGQTFLDLCAAPGNKTAQALESGVETIACDLHWKRLKNVHGCTRVVLDAARPLPFTSKFDRILVDAPCSGTGTLGRNPEIKWRLQPENLAQLASLQRSLLVNALAHLKPDGRLVYSTCSLEKEENQDVVAAVTRTVNRAKLIQTHSRIPGLAPGDGFFGYVLALS